MKSNSFDIVDLAIELEKEGVSKDVINSFVKYEKAKIEYAFSEDKIRFEFELIKKEMRSIESKIISLNRAISGWRNITILVLLIISLLTIFNYVMFNNYATVVSNMANMPCSSCLQWKEGKWPKKKG